MRNVVAIAALAAVVWGCTSPPALRGMHAPFTPPERFAHEYEGRLQLVQVPVEEVAGECASHWFGNHDKLLREARSVMLGCAIPLVGECIVVAVDAVQVYETPQGWRYTTPEDVIAHEVAHCNGWSAEHEH